MRNLRSGWSQRGDKPWIALHQSLRVLKFSCLHILRQTQAEESDHELILLNAALCLMESWLVGARLWG